MPQDRSRRRWTQDDAAKAARDLGLEPLAPYSGNTKSPWPCRCTSCGETIAPTMNKIQQGRRGCRTCAHAGAGRARRMDVDVAASLMRSAGAEPLEPYPGSHQRWRSRCLRCRREIAPTLSGARTQGPCVYCGGNKVDLMVVRAAMERAGLHSLEEFPGSDVPWHCRCMSCDRIVTPRYSSIKSGQSGCKYCARRAVDPDNASAIMQAAGLEPLDVYPGSKTPWPCICTTCGDLVTPTYNSVASGARSGCARCGRARGGLARRIPEEKIKAVMVSAGLDPLEPYPGSMRPWRCRCRVCGREVSPRAHGIQAGQAGCAYCAGHRVDPAAAVALMSSAGIEPTSPFPGSDEPWPSQCATCKRKVSPRYSSIKQGQSGCRYCAGRAVDIDDALRVMRNAHIHPVVPWPGADQPWKSVCIDCSESVYPYYNNVRRGHGGCLHCAGQIVDAEFAAAVMRAADLDPTVPYPGSAVPWSCTCRTCGAHVTPRYAGVRAGQGGCRTCARYGFDPDAPAFVYLIVCQRLSALKIGVSNRAENRLREHIRLGWAVWETDGHACVWPTSSGREAEQIEREILAWWRDELGAPAFLAATDMPQRGASETASLHTADADATAIRVRQLVASAS